AKEVSASASPAIFSSWMFPFWLRTCAGPAMSRPVTESKLVRASSAPLMAVASMRPFWLRSVAGPPMSRAVNGDGREAAVLVTEQGGAADVLGGNGGEAGSRIECAGDVRGANLAVLVSQGGWAGVVDGETVERSPRAHAAADLANFDAAVFVVGFHVTGQGGDFHSTEVIPGTNARRAGHGDFKIRLDAVRFRHFGQVDDEAEAVAVEFGLAGGAGDDLLDDGIAGGADRELPGPGIAAGFRADDADVPQSIVHGEKFQAGGDGGGLGDIGAGVKAGA